MTTSALRDSTTLAYRIPPLLRDIAPGLALVAAISAGAYGLAALVPVLSPLIWGVFLGMAVVVARPLPQALRPGVRVAARHVLRLGVALLGLRLAVDQLAAVGLPALGVLLVSIPVTLAGTLWLGRRLGLSPDLSLLVGTGSAICGASAIAAMDAATDSDEDETTLAVATVTLFGTAAIALLPLLDGVLLHLSPEAFGTWVGASVHEVAGVVATATPGGHSAVETATVVKLTRVMMLAPLVLAVVLWRRRRAPAAVAAPGRRTSPVPLFVLGFLACVAIASSGAVPAPVLAGAQTLDVALLTAALVALGLGASARQIVRLGWRPMALGLGAWMAAAIPSLAAVLLLVR
ncbi:MAG: YeiH family protein [Thermoleophilia bacterium]